MKNSHTGFYSHLNPDIFQRGPSGVIVRSTPITMDIEPNQATYGLKEKSPVERNNLVGLWVNAPKAKPQYATETKSIVNRDAFDSMYLTLRVDTNEIISKIPLHRIEDVNKQGYPYYVQIGARVNLSESSIDCAKPGAIGEKEVVELTADYVIPTTR